MAGPWFTVHRDQGDWKKLDQIWISNGAHDCRGQIEMRITLIDPHAEVVQQEDGEQQLSKLFRP